jgi:hypothetical protein
LRKEETEGESRYTGSQDDSHDGDSGDYPDPRHAIALCNSGVLW